MLGKLLKHEFYSTGRLLLPMYGILVLTTLLTTVMREFFGKNVFLNITVSLVVTAYAVSLILIGASTFLLMLYRFYKNLLGDEGYLMFTLPVSVNHLLLSKVIVSASWTTTTVIFILTSIGIVIGKTSRNNVYQQLVLQLGSNRMNILSAFAIFIILSIVFNTLLIYMSIAIGQQFSKSRLLGSFISYILVYGALQIILTIILIVIALLNTRSNFLDDWTVYLNSNPDILLWGIAPIFLILTVIFYYITANLLTKRLNLE